ncbi:MAG: flagellar hook-length control protein FliK, partial [Candidatus Mucispirillum faecigallinarum]|nr:flagellar hook-length control protein FliK [Candidatus Mucispirillum faecigallinarum]
PDDDFFFFFSLSFFLSSLIFFLSCLSGPFDLSDDFNLSDINEENISLEEISDKILGSEKDEASLEKAYTILEEKISQLNINESGKDNVKVSHLETDNSSSDLKSLDNISEIIEKISSLIDEAVNQSEISDNSEKLGFAKDILQAVQNAAENIMIQSNQANQQTVQSGSEILDETAVINDKSANNTLLNMVSDKVNNTEVKPQETLSNIDTESVQETAELLTDAAVSDDVSAETLKENMKDTLKEAAKETVKETVKESVKESVKDTAKQSDAVSIKDIQKEFKTANVEVTESLRGESAAKAEMKAATVTFNEAGKNLQNNLNQKEMMTGQNNAGENFSTTQSDKGNNFNYFLKSSAEAQAKYETSQSNQSQAAYNMREPRDIERLVRTMQSSVNKGESKLTVVLTPENLGKLQIQLTESGGKVTAKFLSDNENSHKIIMAQSDLLKNQLSEKGIVIDNMEFAYNDAMSKQQNNDEHGRRASKQAQKGKGFSNQEEDLEVGTEVASNKASGIYA